MATSRLMIEYREIRDHEKKTKNADGIHLFPDDDSNLFRWTCILQGPPSTPYASGSFKLQIIIPPSYPHNPPNIKFMTKIFHPNIHFDTGEICLDILKKEWSPTWTLHSSLLAITVLLSTSDPNSPLNCNAGNLLRNGDERGFFSIASMYTIELAGGDSKKLCQSSCDVLKKLT